MRTTASRRKSANGAKAAWKRRKAQKQLEAVMLDEALAGAEGARPGSALPLLDAAFICHSAAAIVVTRGAEHGDKATNFANIADLWNGWWFGICRQRGWHGPTFPFQAGDIGDLMELMKVARRATGTFNLDDYVDAAGYAGCTGEVRANEQSRVGGAPSSPSDDLQERVH